MKIPIKIIEPVKVIVQHEMVNITRLYSETIKETILAEPDLLGLATEYIFINRSSVEEIILMRIENEVKKVTPHGDEKHKITSWEVMISMKNGARYPFQFKNIAIADQFINSFLTQ